MIGRRDWKVGLPDVTGRDIGRRDYEVELPDVTGVTGK